MPKVGMAPLRRKQLIEATVTTVDQLGLVDSTVARIAGEAGLSTGIISHYFGDKEGLIFATMRKMLRDLHDAVASERKAAGTPAQDQLEAIVAGNFDETQINRTSSRAWLVFWAASAHQPKLARLQRVNDRRLYSNLCCQFARVLPLKDARVAARGLAAMIDGLWLRGTLSSDEFDVAGARAIAYQYLHSQLQIAG